MLRGHRRCEWLEGVSAAQSVCCFSAVSCVKLKKLIVMSIIEQKFNIYVNLTNFYFV